MTIMIILSTFLEIYQSVFYSVAFGKNNRFPFKSSPWQVCINIFSNNGVAVAAYKSVCFYVLIRKQKSIVEIGFKSPINIQRHFNKVDQPVPSPAINRRLKFSDVGLSVD